MGKEECNIQFICSYQKTPNNPKPEDGYFGIISLRWASVIPVLCNSSRTPKAGEVYQSRLSGGLKLTVFQS